MKTYLDELFDVKQAGYATEMDQEVVVGPKDDRKPITYFAPWRYICQIRRRIGSSSDHLGTGTLIGPKTILTAAHVPWNLTASSILVLQAKNGPDRIGESLVSRIVYPSGLNDPLKESEYHLDYAILHLKKPLGKTYGYWSFRHKRWKDDPIGTKIWNSTYKISKINANVAGYPGDKGDDFPYWDFDKITENDGKLLSYLHDTASGQSGAPVFYRSGTKKRVLFGIHTGGYGNSRNEAVFINRSVQRFIKRNTK